MQQLPATHFRTLVVVFLIFNTATAQWNQTTFPMDRSVSSIVLNGSKIFVGSHNNGGVLRSTNDGLTWDTAGISDFDVISLASRGSFMLAGTLGSTGGNVFISVDTGNTWQQTSYSTPFYVSSLMIHGGTLFASGNGLVSQSSDSGKSWQSAQSGLTSTAVSALAGDDSMIFAGTADSGVYRSSNDGVNWQPTSLQRHYIFSLTTYGSSVFAGTDSGIFVSTNQGGTWGARSSGLYAGNINALLAVDSFVFAGIFRGGVYRSTINGANWVEENFGLGDTVVYALGVSNYSIFAGTNSGIWKRPISELITSVSDNSGEDIAQAYWLAQNFPNPFNPSTHIKFSIPQSSLVTLEIYDILGRKVHTLVDSELREGAYDINWNAAPYPSGVYFYRMQALPLNGKREGAFTATKKLLIIR